jgi:hypothetical protein
VFSDMPTLDQRLTTYGLLAVTLVPLPWLLVELFLMPGTAGDNRFGPSLNAPH